MNIEDLILISVDDHVIEPPDLFDGRIPAKYKDLAPKVVERSDHSQVWMYDGVANPNVGLNAVAGTPPEEYGIDPTRFDQMRPGCHQIKDRIADMNANGVLGSLCFPTFAQICGQFLCRAADKSLSLAVVRAYNDWHIDEWAGTYPGRIIPLAVTPLWDPQLMAEEVRRVAAKGCHAVAFSENPAKLGLPSFHTSHWDPFWTACVESATTVCLHIGSSSDLPATSEDAPIDVMITLTPLNSAFALADLILSSTLRRFPSLKIALSEGGVGWVPYVLDRADYVYHHHHRWTGLDLGGRLPSQVFRDQVMTCFVHDPTGLKLSADIGTDNMMWECDYPHSDSTWPKSPEILFPTISDLPSEDISKITHENTMRTFSFDPFRYRNKQEATVRSLRLEAEGVDTSIRSFGRGHSTLSAGDMASVHTRHASA